MKKFLVLIPCFLLLWCQVHSYQCDSGNWIKQSGRKVLIVVTSHDKLGRTGKKTGYYLPEVTHPYFQLVKAGFQVDIASIKGGLAPMDESSRDLSDSLNLKFLATREHDRKLQQTLKLSDLRPSDYSAIIFAGGHGTMWDFPENESVRRLSAAIYEEGGIVAAVCHGPAALLNIRLSNGRYLVDGKRVTAFTNREEEAAKLTRVMPFLLETELVKRGAVFESAGLWQKKVVVDQRLVTGQNPASAEELGRVLVGLLKGRACR